MPTAKPRGCALMRAQKAAHRRIARRRIRIEQVHSRADCGGALGAEARHGIDDRRILATGHRAGYCTRGALDDPPALVARGGDTVEGFGAMMVQQEASPLIAVFGIPPPAFTEYSM
jgi:hypothetical protein